MMRFVLGIILGLCIGSTSAQANQFTKNDHVWGLSYGLAKRVLLFNDDETDRDDRLRYICRMKLMAIQLIQVIDSTEKEGEK